MRTVHASQNRTTGKRIKAETASEMSSMPKSNRPLTRAFFASAISIGRKMSPKARPSRVRPAEATGMIASAISKRACADGPPKEVSRGVRGGQRADRSACLYARLHLKPESKLPFHQADIAN